MDAKLCKKVIDGCNRIAEETTAVFSAIACWHYDLMIWKSSR